MNAPNEITAEMLAREAVDIFGEGEREENWLQLSQEFLILTRALASLQAERAKDAPERVRCWMSSEGLITDDIDIASKWKMDGYTVTPGWFTPDTKGSPDD